jgi:hypothetical protein
MRLAVRAGVVLAPRILLARAGLEHLDKHHFPAELSGFAR